MTESNRRSGAYETPEIPLLQSAINWSEYKDSNLGPSGPKPDALPDCATLRIFCYFITGSLDLSTPLSAAACSSVINFDGSFAQ